MAVPLIKTAPASEFGDHTASVDFNDPTLMGRDLSYVPGFSDLRRQRDLKVAEYVHHKVDRSAIPELPVNMRWSRNQGKDGKPDSTKVIGHATKGYHMATKADIGQPWLTALPPGSSVDADGTIRKGDTALMVATKEDAARNAHIKAELTARRVSGMEHGFAAKVEQDRSGWRGAEPTAKKETLSPINVPVAKAAGK